MAGEAWIAQLEMLRQQLPVIVAQTCRDTAVESEQTIAQKIKDNAENTVYSYPASARAEQYRRYDMGYLHPQIGSTETSIVFDFKPKISLQHTTSKNGRHYGANAVRVVEEGLVNYNQPYERLFLLDEDEESEIIGEIFDRKFGQNVERYL